MKDFLTYLVKAIVDTPSQVDIEEKEIAPNSFQYLIHAKAEDIGKIIGKEGKNITAIRNIAKILAIKENKQVRIEIS
ncbi:KH domain-containing protein [Candidatus Microgenomates bacterium]|nr:KH domain-containing protein [Candidatus Microgenomates bacterium]